MAAYDSTVVVDAVLTIGVLALEWFGEDAVQHLSGETGEVDGDAVSSEGALHVRTQANGAHSPLPARDQGPRPGDRGRR